MSWAKKLNNKRELVVLHVDSERPLAREGLDQSEHSFLDDDSRNLEQKFGMPDIVERLGNVRIQTGRLGGCSTLQPLRGGVRSFQLSSPALEAR